MSSNEERKAKLRAAMKAAGKEEKSLSRKIMESEL